MIPVDERFFLFYHSLSYLSLPPIFIPVPDFFHPLLHRFHRFIRSKVLLVGSRLDSPARDLHLR
jgi:hypothetical protein